jgi:hypothetical protein
VRWFAGAGKENVLKNVKPGSSTPVKVEACSGLVEFLTPTGREMALVTGDEFDNEGVVLARIEESRHAFLSSCNCYPCCNDACAVRFPSSLRGPSPSIRAKVGQYNVSRSMI